MKATSFSLLALGSLLFLLTACSPKEPALDQSQTEIDTTTTANETVTETPTVTPTLTDEEESTNTLSSTEHAMNCSEAVQQYLQASSPTGDGEAVVSNGNDIVVDYIGRLADGSVFDTSVEAVARACGTYTDGRDYREGLPFTVGAGQMIAGFDTGVVGMKVGQTKTIEIPARDAYGEISEEDIVTYPLSEVPDPENYTEGMKFYAYGSMPVTVVRKTDTEITLDFNHELAGKDLIFDITLKEIQ